VRRAFLAIASFLSVTHISPAWADGRRAATLVGAFHETLQKDVSVSGSVMVGIAAGSLARGSDVQRIAVRFPPDLAGQKVCLTVQSRDGTYLSRNSYELPPATNQPIPVPYQTSHLGVLKHLKSTELAYSILEGECGTPGARYLLPINMEEADDEIVRVMVNGFRATDVFYRLAGSAHADFCNRIAEGRTTVFDFVCEIPVTRAMIESSMTIDIEREIYGRAQPTVRAVIAGFLAPPPSTD
jgi:hypothetical protein